MTDAANPTPHSPAERPLVAEVVIAASPARVWQVLTDLDRMPDWSPELVRMVPLRRGGLRVGQHYLGINRRKAVVWPTRSVVTAMQPERLLVWDTVTSGARWTFELSADPTGTRLVQRRTVPTGLHPVAKVFAPLLLGGTDEHADELDAGMQTTLERLKAEVERPS